MEKTQTYVKYDPDSYYAVGSRDVVYRQEGERQWLARIHQPLGPGPFPLLIEVHGGQWTNNDRTQNESIDRALAACGLVIAAIDFHSADEAPYPAAMQDISYATRWLKAHAADFEAGAWRMGGIGFSSGGHMLMLSAMRPRDRRYSAIPLMEASGIDASLAYVVMAWPVIDPLSRYYFAAETGRDDMVQSALRCFGDEAGMSEANPQHILDRGEVVALPPALLVQGGADAQLTPGMAERFVESYARAGGVIELGKYPGEGHGFARTPGQNTDRAISQIASFIGRQLEIPPRRA